MSIQVSANILFYLTLTSIPNDHTMFASIIIEIRFLFHIGSGKEGANYFGDFFFFFLRIFRARFLYYLQFTRSDVYIACNSKDWYRPEPSLKSKGSNRFWRSARRLSSPGLTAQLILKEGVKQRQAKSIFIFFFIFFFF